MQELTAPETRIDHDTYTKIRRAKLAIALDVNSSHPAHATPTPDQGFFTRYIPLENGSFQSSATLSMTGDATDLLLTKLHSAEYLNAEQLQQGLTHFAALRASDAPATTISPVRELSATEEPSRNR